MSRAFLAGLLYEGLCTGWVRWVSSGNVLFASCAAFLCALSIVTGVTESTKRRAAALAYCTGCAIGSGIMTWLSSYPPPPPYVFDWCAMSRPLTSSMREVLHLLRAGHRLERNRDGTIKHFNPEGTNNDCTVSMATVKGLRVRDLVFVTSVFPERFGLTSKGRDLAHRLEIAQRVAHD